MEGGKHWHGSSQVEERNALRELQIRMALQFDQWSATLSSIEMKFTYTSEILWAYFIHSGHNDSEEHLPSFSLGNRIKETIIATVNWILANLWPPKVIFIDSKRREFRIQFFDQVGNGSDGKGVLTWGHILRMKKRKRTMIGINLQNWITSSYV